MAVSRAVSREIVEKTNYETFFVTGSVDLNILVDDLKRAGSFVRLAYNGVAGFHELQISIRQIGLNISNLCSKSSVTVTKFKLTSGNILTNLRSSYEYLSNGQGSFALKTLASTAIYAKRMATAAEELQEAFEEEADNVEKVLSKTIRTKGTEEERKKDLEKLEKQLQIDKEKAKADMASADEGLKQFEKLHIRAEEKQESYKSSNPIMALANGLLFLLSGGNYVDPDERRAQQACGEKLKHLEEMKKQRELHKKALEDFVEFSKKIEQCKDDAQLASVVIDALHQAIGALKKLSNIMKKTAEFWKMMQVHCDNLAETNMQDKIEMEMKQTEENRLYSWKNDAFQKMAIEYYSKWEALNGICGVLLVKIKGAQEELYKYLEENLTLDEARASIRKLANDFTKDLTKAHKEITEKEIEEEENIQQLNKKSGASEGEPN